MTAIVMFQRLLVAAGAVAAFAGCSNDLDLTAPYKESTVVYALLDRDSTTQYFKINKAFLGDGNALVYAQVADSNEYTDEQLQAVAEALNAQGQVTATYPLHDTLLDHDAGLFFGPQHKLYYFNAAATAEKYRLKATAKGNQVSAEASVVADFAVNQSLLSPAFTLPFVSPGGSSYSNFTVKWTSAVNGKRYDLSYRFNYDETTNSGTEHKSFTQFLGTVTSDGLGGGQALELPMNGETFFQTVRDRVKYADASAENQVTQRTFLGVDFMWSVAGFDLHTYLQLASPFSGIAQDRPVYSNVVNGFGLFSSRIFKEATGKQLNSQSTGELANGQYTQGMHF